MIDVEGGVCVPIVVPVVSERAAEEGVVAGRLGRGCPLALALEELLEPGEPAKKRFQRGSKSG